MALDGSWCQAQLHVQPFAQLLSHPVTEETVE
jgi:hypothetical protein